MSNIKNRGCVVRSTDALGRVVIPKEIRKQFGIAVGTPMEISVQGEQIVVTKHKFSCVFCGSQDTLGEFRGRTVCAKCREALRDMADKGQGGSK